MTGLWITVPGWDKFQGYRHRDPPWIRVYTRLAHKDEWLSLTLGQRGLLVTIWIEYALSDQSLSVEAVRKQVGRGFKQGSLKRLADAGLIVLSASKPVRQRQRRVKPVTRARQNGTAGDALPIDEQLARIKQLAGRHH